MAVEVHTAWADHWIGLVDVVQALKLKLGIQLRPVTLCCACARLQANLHSRSVHDVSLYQPRRYALLLYYSYTITVSNANSKHHCVGCAHMHNNNYDIVYVCVGVYA